MGEEHAAGKGGMGRAGELTWRTHTQTPAVHGGVVSHAPLSASVLTMLVAGQLPTLRNVGDGAL